MDPTLILPCLSQTAATASMVLLRKEHYVTGPPDYKIREPPRQIFDVIENGSSTDWSVFTICFCMSCWQHDGTRPPPSSHALQSPVPGKMLNKKWISNWWDGGPSSVACMFLSGAFCYISPRNDRYEFQVRWTFHQSFQTVSNVPWSMFHSQIVFLCAQVAWDRAPSTVRARAWAANWLNTIFKRWLFWNFRNDDPLHVYLLRCKQPNQYESNLKVSNEERQLCLEWGKLTSVTLVLHPSLPTFPSSHPSLPPSPYSHPSLPPSPNSHPSLPLWMCHPSPSTLLFPTSFLCPVSQPVTRPTSWTPTNFVLL